MRILFMGTPDFARIALERLICGDFEVAAVVTQPDKPVGRRQALMPPPVKQCALAHGIRVHQPERLRGSAFAEFLGEVAPDIIVVAAYGKILPKSVLEYAGRGCVNIHASLLPKYRGAAPINAAIINGERVTGITIIKMDEGIDTGDMLLKRALEIGADETAGELHDRLAALGGELICEALELIKSGSAKLEKQPEEGASYAEKIDNKACEIDWGLPARRVHDKIRGLAPVPAAFTLLDGKKLKIYKSRVADDGVLELLEVQIEGGKKMSAGDFLNGRKNRQDIERAGNMFRFAR